MLRVARIVPEFCARTTSKNGVTPCAGRTKEFLARRVFYLFNRCTNVIVRRVMWPSRPRLGTEDGPTTDYWLLPFSPLTTLRSLRQDRGRRADGRGQTGNRALATENCPSTAESWPPRKRGTPRHADETTSPQAPCGGRPSVLCLCPPRHISPVFAGIARWRAIRKSVMFTVMR
jgi:hypothetical protein